MRAGAPPLPTAAERKPSMDNEPRAKGAGTTAWTKPPRVFHGPKNITGIGRYLADWQRARGAQSDFIVFADDTTRQNHHYSLHLERRGPLGSSWALMKNFFSCLRRYDLFHFYFGETLLPVGLKFPLPFSPDLPILKLFGKRIVMTYCGSDIRLHEVERRRNPYVKYLEAGKLGSKYDRRKKLRMWWQNLFVDRFIAVRNLYAYATEVIPAAKVERNILVNNTVDTEAFAPQEYTTKDIPVVIHAPTSPKVKGTEYVEKAIAELKQEGYKFEYRKLHGVPNDEAHRIYREEADIIVDQVLIGGFGTLAVEGMYYGRPVCCYLLPELLEWYPDCPIVNTNPDDIKQKLAWLIENPDERVRLGRQGRAFIEKHFSREKVNQQVWDMYHALMSA